MRLLATGYSFFETQDEINDAFYSSYPQHKPGIVTSESSSDYSDFFDSLCRLNRVHYSLVVD